VTADSVLHRPYPDQVALLRRSPLAGRAAELAAGSGDAVRLAELPFLTQVNLRVDPGSAAAPRIAQALGCPLPSAGTVTGAGERSVLWLGPDEWLVVGPDGDAGALVTQLTAALAASRDGERGSVVDVSADRTTVTVEGPAAQAVLEKGITLDLHPRAFSADRAAATTLARTLLLLWQTGDAPGYRLMVRSSFADYLADWLLDAAAEFTSGSSGSRRDRCSWYTGRARQRMAT
jgi:sarcosine oxidase, subunit gamma